MKILVMAGHGDGDPGAYGCGYWEANETRTAAALLVEKLSAYNVSVERYPSGKNAFKEIQNGRVQNFRSYDLVIEIHFNAYNGAAHGTETYWRSSASKKAATAVNSAIAGRGFTNRGIKYGNWLVQRTVTNQGVPQILVETCFIDNAADMKRYKACASSLWADVAASLASAYGFGTAKKSVNKPASAPAKAPASAKIAVDGSWGKATTSLAQRVLGTSVDGIVSNQPLVNKKYLPNCYTGSWEFKSSGYKAGSAMVRALQRMVGASVDGYCGPNTVKCLQKYLGVSVDGYCGPATVKAWQTHLNSKVK